MAHVVYWFEGQLSHPVKFAAFVNGIQRMDYKRIVDLDTGTAGICFDNLSNYEAQAVTVLVDV